MKLSFIAFRARGITLTLELYSKSSPEIVLLLHDSLVGPKTSMEGPWGALRLGDLKLLVEQDGTTVSLYNISEDANEAADLAARPASPPCGPAVPLSRPRL